MLSQSVHGFVAKKYIACVKLVPRVLSLTRFYVWIDVVSIDQLRFIAEPYIR